jgi:hypothetical protein
MHREHIYRKHHAPIRCGRCQKIFGEQKDLDSHQQEDNECEKQPTTLPKGWITTAQERELRKRHPGQSDLENWNNIFAILFPNDACPSSPCMYTGLGRVASERCDAYASQITMMTVSAASKILLWNICLCIWKRILVLLLTSIHLMDRRRCLSQMR